MLAGGKLELAGLHAHVGTSILEPRAYRDAGAHLAGFATQLRERFGTRLRFFDVGGGFASRNTLKAQYLLGEQATPSFDQYAEALVEGLAAYDAPPDEIPTLVLVTGRALVDDAGYLITTVRADKRLPDGRRAVVVDAGVNMMFTSFWCDHDVAPAQSLRGMAEPTVIYGPLCMNIDVLREHLLLPPLEVGDRLVFRNVGAYNVTQWMQFITLRPAVALVGTGGDVALLRRAETLDDVIGPEEVPPWLSPPQGLRRSGAPAGRSTRSCAATRKSCSRAGVWWVCCCWARPSWSRRPARWGSLRPWPPGPPLERSASRPRSSTRVCMTTTQSSSG